MVYSNLQMCLLSRCIDQVSIPRFHYLRPKKLSWSETLRKSLVHRQGPELPSHQLREKSPNRRIQTGMSGTVLRRDRIPMQVRIILTTNKMFLKKLECFIPKGWM